MKYSVEVVEQVWKDVRRLPPKHLRQVLHKMYSLEDEPRPQDCQPVISMPGCLRVDSGEYRIIYEVDDMQRTVFIVRVRHRKDVYR